MKSNWLIPFSLTAIMVAVCAMNAATQDNAPSQTPDHASELDNFDKAVQQRFHDVIGFGMGRISSERWFVPETPEEKEAVKGLQRAGYEVCLFLVGRGVLQDVPENKHVSHSRFGTSDEHLMSGPLYLKKNEVMRGLPAGLELWEPSRKAFQAFANGDTRYSFQVRGWKIEARPVRADGERCLRCHGHGTRLTFHPDGSYLVDPTNGPDNLRIGDTVGMLLYAYKNKSEKP